MSLQRYIEAQNGALKATYTVALREIKHNKRRSRWIPYIMPKLAALEESDSSRTYGLKSKEEAIEFLHHPILGRRLKKVCHDLLMINGLTIMDIMGTPYDEDVHACMTLFYRVTDKGSEENGLFLRMLDKYFDNRRHAETVDILGPRWKY